jgi:anti-sigma regulatory factor (Ser/Thr protein kinase)
MCEPPPEATVLFFEATDLAKVRRVVVEQSKVADLDEDRTGDLTSAVNEVATNSVVHGGGSGTLRTWVTDDRIVCEIRDFGMISSPLAGRLRPPPSSESGRGLVLVHYLSDLVQTYTCQTGTTTRLHFLR